MVELMVVVIIMAILGLAVMPALMGSSEKAKYSRAWGDLDAIANAFTAYYGKEGNLPDKEVIDDGDFAPAAATLSAEEKLLQSFLGTQLADLYDPWNERYQIKSTWNAATGKGHIIVFVKGTGSVTFGGTSGAITISGVRQDPYNKDKEGQDLPMAKLVINVM